MTQGTLLEREGVAFVVAPGSASSVVIVIH
jgi:hypothetical protein